MLYYIVDFQPPKPFYTWPDLTPSSVLLYQLLYLKLVSADYNGFTPENTYRAWSTKIPNKECLIAGALKQIAHLDCGCFAGDLLKTITGANMVEAVEFKRCLWPPNLQLFSGFLNHNVCAKFKCFHLLLKIFCTQSSVCTTSRSACMFFCGWNQVCACFYTRKPLVDQAHRVWT